MSAIVFARDGQARTTSILIAQGVGVQHKNLLAVIRNYQNDFEAFGRVAFEMQAFETNGGIQKREIAILNEQQATLLVTYCKNTEIVRKFKVALVKAFCELREQLHPICPAHAQLPPPSLSEQQAYAIMSEVAKRAKNCGAHYQTIYRALKARYQVTKYTHIPASAFDDAVAFIRSVDLRVPEIVPADEAECRLPEERFLSDSELLALRKLYSFHCDPYWKDCAVAAFKVLDAAHSRFAGRFYDLINEPVFSLFKVEDILKRNGMMPTTN